MDNMDNMDNTDNMDNITPNKFSVWDIETIIHFVKDNIPQLLLVLLVFVIIYIVDHLAKINAILYAMPVPIVISQQLANTGKPRKKSKQSKQ